MEWFFSMTYLWLKAGHVIFVIFWMAGLFMLPRFFVYHQEAEPGSPEAARWVEREARLLKIILWPAMGLVWLLGLALASSSGAWSAEWLHIKLAAVLALSAYHIWMASYASTLARGECRLTAKQMRLVNEVPGVLAVIIVIMAVVKPF